MSLKPDQRTRALVRQNKTIGSVLGVGGKRGSRGRLCMRGWATPWSHALSMSLGCPLPGVTPQDQQGAETFPSDIRYIRPKDVSQIRRARAIARRDALGSSPWPPLPAVRWASPAPSPPQFFPASQLQRLEPPQDGPGPLPGTTRRSQDPHGNQAAAPCPTGELESCFRSPRGPAPAPTPAAPELRLMRFSQPSGSFSSSAIFPPAAAPAPPPPHHLCHPRPPTTAAYWLVALKQKPGNDTHWAP